MDPATAAYIRLGRAWRDYQPDAPVKTLADVIAWNRAHAAQAMPFFGQEFFEQAEAMKGLDAPEYQEALAACRRFAPPSASICPDAAPNRTDWRPRR